MNQVITVVAFAMSTLLYSCSSNTAGETDIQEGGVTSAVVAESTMKKEPLVLANDPRKIGPEKPLS